MFSLVLPFHTDVERILVTLDFLRQARRAPPISEFLLCHNGSSLRPDQESRIRKSLPDRGVLLHTDRRGIGAGYKLGIGAARAEFVILSASDLPFGFSDVRSFLSRRHLPPGEPRFAIGSKSHPGSQIRGYGLMRRLASVAFWQLRVLLLGSGTPRDSQGSLIVETALARKLSHHCRHDNYFFSVEIITLAQRQGIQVVELPVILEHHRGDSSSVSLFRDGFEMARNLFNLRRRLKTET